MQLRNMNKNALSIFLDDSKKSYESFKAKGLKLSITRGVPEKRQLELSGGLLRILDDNTDFSSGGLEARNYGGLDGLPAAKKLFAELLGVSDDMIIIGGASSLNLMYDMFTRSMLHGVCGNEPWVRQKSLKFLCPSPGYDRHFSICEHFGIEMITVKMTGDGPDMDEVERLVSSDAAIKGIWCVPKYSNPDGIVYSDETVRRMAALKPAAADFRIFWDNAYCVHDLYDDCPQLLNIFDECRKAGSEDMVYEFVSTAKISFPGGGVAALAASRVNIDWIMKQLFFQTICYDKINQLRHVLYFKNAEGIRSHMRRHAEILRPKFEAVGNMLEKELGTLGIAEWKTPRGGYFISVDVYPGCASRVVSMMADAGVQLTAAGSTFPYKKDPEDKNIRLSVTVPTPDELVTATELFCVCVKLTAAEKMLG